MKPTRRERAELLRRIGKARRDLRLSYVALGERAGVDPSQVSRICRGEFMTFSDSVVRICTVLGVKLRSTGKEPPPALPSQGPIDAAWAKLERSMRQAWDETPRGADRLAKVISAVAEIGRR